MWSFRRFIHKVGGLISKAVPCTGDINANGGTGIYELQVSIGTALGLAGVKYNAQGVPDRFQIIYDGNIVADSLFVGDSLTGTPPNYSGLIGSHNLAIFEYNGTAFVNTGNTEVINVTLSDISDRVNEPTNGNGTILFEKTTAEPSVMTIRATGVSGTAWNLSGICPFPVEDAVEGTYKVMNGFYTEANKGTTTLISSGMILGDSPIKFYTNERGDTDFNTLGWTATNRWINDATIWWEIDSTGNILSTGVL